MLSETGREVIQAIMQKNDYCRLCWREKWHSDMDFQTGGTYLPVGHGHAGVVDPRVSRVP